MALPDDPQARKLASRRERERERYATDPEFAEKKRARAREWGRKNAETNRAKAAAWAAANPAKVAETHRNWYIRNREMMRSSRLKGAYGLTAIQFDQLLVEQKGVCAICRSPETSSRCKSLSVDHCHETRRVRGLLCNRCNRAIGLFRDSGDLLQAAAGYLWHHQRRSE